MIAAVPQTTPTTDPSTTSSTTTNNNDELNSNDFITLLVSQLQNQDPTQPMDPTTFVTQLVQFNSLEQLISINQDLTPAATPPATSTNGSGSTPSTQS